ncbi:sensor histidine kinase [Paenibacillus hexagrammi]|uniref:histidine kinase n=1 Tax=Paenibacillus hexagrammi TaxID=2908839 RepID=A0ABY3SD10_9BACL|nr:ATP-binding protein [Paenibacillus sp. YPD9-1]UJF31882.1 ATP-binding protein [Paenibacillus sp. YPD9-1]
MNTKTAMQKKQLRFSAFILMIALIIVLLTDSVFYHFTKSMLTSQLEERMQLIADNVAVSIKLSKTGQSYVENLIGVNLRTASVAAQYRLNPDIEKVSNEELVQLSKELMVDHITLMKRSGDDIIGYKSSDPKEINLSTKGWSHDWFKAFNQLLDTTNANVASGQTLPHYWSGPLNTSSSNPQYVDKWGYYYDGTTNYIIDPYVHDTYYNEYQEKTGVDSVIQEMVHNNTNNGAKEISIFNPPIFLKQQEQYKQEGYTWFADREILFGSYTMKDDRDREYVQEVMSTKQRKQFISTLDGKQYLKMFIPLQLDFPVVVGLTADYEQVQASLRQQQTSLLILIVSTAIVAFIIVFLSIRLINRNKEAAVESIQEVYIENIDSLFRSMKEQRHDFNNHVATISSLVYFKQYEELQKYTNEFIGETTALNDIIQINVPALCAIVQSKVIQAVERKINFQHEVENLNRLQLGALKATDMVKIVSNLVDNAFEAVSHSGKASDLEVKLIGRIENKQLVFEVINNGLPIPENMQNKIFEAGFTTKASSGKNSGLGLHIVKKIVDTYHGSIHVKSDDDQTRFQVAIPV